MARVPFIAAFASMALASPAVADDEHPAELAARKAEFEREFAALVAPVNKAYAAALRSREREFAIAKNYEAAIAAREERLSIERSKTGASATDGAAGEQKGTAQVSNSKSALTFAAASASSLSGATAEGEAVRFSKTGDAAEWLLESVTPGAYEVRLTYAAPAAASIKVQEYFFRLSGELPATKDGKSFEDHSLGILKLTASATRIRLTAGTGSILVKDVRLIPR